jgi:glutamine synthetase
MADAIALLESSAFARDAFGERSYEHVLHFARTELACYETAVTDFERARYFERI